MSNKIETKEIPFHDDTLLGVRTEDGKVWLAVNRTCLGIGLTTDQAKKQSRNIKKSLLFNDKWKKIAGAKFGTTDHAGTTLVIHEDMVPIWLAQIRLTPKMKKENPEATKKLLAYQLEAAKVLHNAFYKSEKQKEELHKELGLEGQIVKELSEMKEELHDQSLYFQKVMENMTLSTAQQGKILKAGKDRVNHLLGGAHSQRYKDNSRKYFVNLWNGLKSTFLCSSYKDLNPAYYEDAIKYIAEWDYEDSL